MHAQAYEDLERLRFIAPYIPEWLDNLPFKYKLGRHVLYGDRDGEPLFTDNESDMVALYGPGADNGRKYFKDAFHRQVVNGDDAGMLKLAPDLGLFPIYIDSIENEYHAYSRGD